MTDAVLIRDELRAARCPLKKDGGPLDSDTRQGLTKLEALLLWADAVTIWPDVWLLEAEPLLIQLDRETDDEALPDEDRARFLLCAWRLRRAIVRVRVAVNE